MSKKRSKKNERLGQDLLASGMFWLTGKKDELILEALLKSHRDGINKQAIENIVHEHYYIPYQDQHKQNYLSNIDLLRNYSYINSQDYPDFDELSFQFIPVSTSKFAIYDQKKCEFISDIDLTIQLDVSQCKIKEVYLIKNEFRVDNILAYEKASQDPQPFLWSRTPLFLYYTDINEFVQYLQLFDFSPVLESNRIVFLFGMEELEQYFSDPQAFIPKRLFNTEGGEKDDVAQYILHRNELIQEEVRDLQDRVNSYYNNISMQKLLASIKGGKPHILFVTSRFTTALQYYSRDCALACEKLGIPNQTLVQNSNLHGFNRLVWLKILNDFKPDIVFCIDFLRYQSPFLPQNMLFINWVQDDLPNIASREAAASIGPLDFILNAYFSNNKYLLDFGYPSEAIIAAPVGANPYIYKSYSLDQKEQELYGADLFAISNPGNPQKGLDYFLAQISDSPIDNLEKVFKLAYRDMYESFYQEKIIYSHNEYINFIAGHFEANDIIASKEVLDTLARVWRDEVGYRICRSIPFEWLHEKAYDMKLWGSEWVDHPVLNSYAQGVAANGETLSKIINTCKIVIGTNPGMTTHPRAFESILSNSMYIAYRIPEENDWANIRNYLKEDREIVFAHSREDLYAKVDYYLENEAARRKIISGAQKKILEHLTYEALMSRVLREIALKLEEPRNGV